MLKPEKRCRECGKLGWIMLGLLMNVMLSYKMRQRLSYEMK